ncbi:MAG TPA: sigma-70 family RNA polymerase sigma factor, partial [Armatimonadota bacterium]|nr:sigma-70 family RNA polymerase sigma factor [Armatimonadota bacterium]
MLALEEPIDELDEVALPSTRLRVPALHEALYAELQPLVRGLIRQYGIDADLRQELPGEIFCRFCMLLDAYDPERGVPLRAYMIRSLKASVYTYVRRYWSHRRREVALEPEEGGTEPSDEGAAAKSWEFEIVKHDVLKGLPDAVSRLSKRQRQVVIMRFYDGVSFE